MASNYLYKQSETVRQKMLPFWGQTKYGVVTDIIERQGEEERINERDFRIPVDTEPGGRPGAYNPAGGDMGRGSAPKGNVMIGSYFSLRLNYEIDFLSRKATENKPGGTAGKPPFATMVADAMENFADYIDRFFHSDGTAVLATATSHAVVSGKSVYTMDSLNGVNLLRRGQYVIVYSNDLSTQRDATRFIEAIDYNAKTVRLSGTVAGATTTDKITFEGVTGASPTGLRGLYYWVSTATSGTTAGIDRAVELEMIANGQTAAAGLNHEIGMRQLDRLLLRYRNLPDFVGLCNVNPRAQIFKDVISLQNFDISGGAKQIDRLPKQFQDPKRSFQWCGVPHMIDANEDQTRIDWLVPKLWGRALLDKMRFYEVGNDRFFPLYGASGAPAAALWFGLTVDLDYYCIQPGMQAVINNIPIDSLY